MPKRLLGPSTGNELGHWEPVRLVRIHDQILSEVGSQWDDWRGFDPKALGERYIHFQETIASNLEEDFGSSELFVLKDPRICRLMPLYADVAAQLNLDLRCIITYRRPAEVADSLATRNGITSDYSKMIWARHILDAEATSRTLKRVFVSYDTLMEDVEGVCSRIAKSLDIEWPVSMFEARAGIDAFLSPEHRHHIASENGTTDDDIGKYADQILGNIQELSRNPDNTQAMANLSLLRKELNKPRKDFLNATFDELIRRQKSLSRVERQLRQSQADLNAAKKSLTQSQGELRQSQVDLKTAKLNLAQTQEQLQQSQVNLKATDENLIRLQDQANRLQSSLKATQARAEALERSKNEMLTSYSWRATRPLRQLSRFLGSVTRGSQG